MNFRANPKRGDKTTYGGKAWIFDGSAYYSVYPHNRRRLYTFRALRLLVDTVTNIVLFTGYAMTLILVVLLLYVTGVILVDLVNNATR